jgi:hypothetical protein
MTMTKLMTTLALVALIPAGAALASDDDCFVPREQWQSREAVMKLAQDNGWTIREFKVDDGCYEIEGRDREGRKIEVELDPGTLAVIKMETYGQGYGSQSIPGATPAPAPAPTPAPATPTKP